MSKPSVWIDLSLLKTHHAFRAVFCARLLSLVSLGLLGIAVAVQVQTLTGSPWKVGLAVALAGSGMLVGLLVGGVLADRYERRRLILLARSACGLGFVGLWANALQHDPSVLVIYMLAAWDGFFGALGVTALLAATPALVGRENLPKAGAISQLTVRLGSIVTPVLGGVLIASGGVAWNYALVAIGTLLTVLLLRRLPQLPATRQHTEHPLRALAAGFAFVRQHPAIGAVAVLGSLITMASAIRVMFPALAADWYIGASELGLLYAATPLGAATGALTSGRIAGTVWPGRWLIGTALAGLTCAGVFSLMPVWWQALPFLAAFGYLAAVNGLLQYNLIQAQTPDALLGRVNSLWTAQNVGGDALGAAMLGMLGGLMAPVAAATTFGLAAGGLGLGVVLKFGQLRHLVFEPAEARVQDPAK